MMQQRDPWNPWPRWSAFALSTPTDGLRPAAVAEASPSRATAAPVLIRCFVRGADGVVEPVALPSAATP